MKAVQLTGIRQMALAQVAAPRIQTDHDVLLKLQFVGVCGSDVHYYRTGRIGSHQVEYPFVVGHECSATVIETGRAVDRVRAGDAVAIEPAMPCGRCDQCRSGRENTCRRLRFLGCPGQAEGCLCEYLVMPQDSLFPTGDRITLEQAVLCEPLSIGLYAVRQSGIGPEARIAVLGAGPIGLSVLLAARYQGLQALYASEKIPAREEYARQAGACWVGNPQKEDLVSTMLDKEPLGFDAVFECAGEQETVDQAIELLKPGGRLMLIGIPELERISFVIDQMRRREITLINVRRQNRCVQPAIDMVASGQVDVDFMITHRLGLDQTQTAFDLLDHYRDGIVKALIKI
ncbi:MAG: alcohol dehydrogenase catalytic domain-containing protein [Sedimentisphaerales bacterium]|nr:alcohol dehydrogenase catalytic domain-containing protein [Sedimentisphaerales bacterium]